MEKQTFLKSGAFKLIVFLLGLVLLAAILAPPIYFSGKFIVAKGWLEGGLLDSINGSMDRAKFTRYFNRSVLLSALLLTWPTLKWMNAGRGEKIKVKDFLGLDPNPSKWKHLILGFLVAAGTLLLLGGFYVSQGWYEVREFKKSLVSILLSALGTGLAVGFLEEFVFRGALHALFAKLLKPIPLLITVAAIFALVHFFNAPHSLEIPAVTWTSGFWMVGRLFEHFFSQFADPYFLLAEFAVLFAIGLVLGYTRMKTGSLWLGIGLHAGWVFGVKMLSPMTVRAFDRAEMMPWLGDTLRVGLASTLVVLLTGAVISFGLRKSPRSPFSKSLT